MVLDNGESDDGKTARRHDGKTNVSASKDGDMKKYKGVSTMSSASSMNPRLPRGKQSMSNSCNGLRKEPYVTGCVMKTNYSVYGRIELNTGQAIVG